MILYLNLPVPLSPTDRESAKPYLPAVIQFYLLQQAYLEHHKIDRGGPRILVAAPSAQVAHLISALSKLLPWQLLRDMTFSTYEHDVQKQHYRICGICLLPSQSNNSSRILNLDSYTTDFVIDTYAERELSMSDDFLPELYKRAVIHYAKFMTKYFYYSVASDIRVEAFLKKMELIPNLTVETFLGYYYATFVASGETQSAVTKLPIG